ncbi:glycosyltransferase [Piscinibacter koreensis]|uniref:Glycosyltransferase n=1 Tax=Piscinibacter koreensis TaxID=2742824 RepID=A0A7Y6NRU3_9BURK|nr:glycosyltransferase [Schlegelella koreensis]NUZ08183.1 glycosyltransferase [Schlegelella koreensis]
MPIFGILVAYHTDVARLDSILTVLTPQCAIVLADNSEDHARSAEIRAVVLRHGGTYLAMNGNQGIGAAQNAALDVARRNGADACLLLDDDSVPAPDIVSVLLAACQALGGCVVVCANALDCGGREIGNVRTHGRRFAPCRDMMSSGSLIPRLVLDEVGSFDGSLFIDGVDFDWGWRAQARGVSIVLTRETSITHRLGEGTAAGVRVPSPVRHYYQYRNVLLLMKRPHTPWRWRMAQAFKLPVKLVLIALLMPPRAARLRHAFAGIRDAVRGVTGRMPPSEPTSHATLH